MRALLGYMHELGLMDDCVVHGKEFMYRHKVDGKATKNLLTQEYVYYCIQCLYEYDKEERDIVAAMKNHVCRGVR